MARREYRSAIRSRRLIREAFFELLQEKEFERITVTDIVNRADLNRSTFYAHYPDIWAVAEEIQNEIVDATMDVVRELKYTSIFQDPMPFLVTVAKPLQANQALYRQLSSSNYAQTQLEKIKCIFIEHAMNSPDIPEELRTTLSFRIRIDFFIGGIINVYQQWIQGDLNCSIDDISIEIAKVIKKSAQDVLSAD